MAIATEATVFFGTLTGILHLFRVFPEQHNTKVALHGLLAALAVLLVFGSLAAGRFSNIGVGLLAFLAAIGSLMVSVAVYRNTDPKSTPGLVAMYAMLQMLTLVLVLGSASLGMLR